jgi:hypothetical protein
LKKSAGGFGSRKNVAERETEGLLAIGATDKEAENFKKNIKKLDNKSEKS